MCHHIKAVQQHNHPSEQEDSELESDCMSAGLRRDLGPDYVLSSDRPVSQTDLFDWLSSGHVTAGTSGRCVGMPPRMHLNPASQDPQLM